MTNKKMIDAFHATTHPIKSDKTGASELSALLCGKFELTEKDRALYEFATQYHEDCEAYDKIVCGGEHNGVAIPVDRREMVLINRNALSVRARIINEAGKQEIAKDEIVRAIQRWNGTT